MPSRQRVVGLCDRQAGVGSPFPHPFAKSHSRPNFIRHQITSSFEFPSSHISSYSSPRTPRPQQTWFQCPFPPQEFSLSLNCDQQEDSVVSHSTWTAHHPSLQSR